VFSDAEDEYGSDASQNDEDVFDEEEDEDAELPPTEQPGSYSKLIPGYVSYILTLNLDMRVQDIDSWDQFPDHFEVCLIRILAHQLIFL
jgi:hypothetical protein